MSILRRIKILWLGFWNSVVGAGESSNETLVAQGHLREQERQLVKLREAMTNLVFQKKRLEGRLSKNKDRQNQLKEDLEQSAKEDRDELAMHLIAQVEEAQGEARFFKQQLEKLDNDIIAARKTEQELVEAINRAKQIMGSLTTRYQALELRKQLKTELSSVTRSLDYNSISAATDRLNDQISRLEIELDGVDSAQQPNWKHELKEMRDLREKDRLKEKLSEVKEKFRPKAVKTKERAPVRTNVQAVARA